MSERLLRSQLVAVPCQSANSERKPMNSSFENRECREDSTAGQHGRLQNGAPVLALVVDDSRPSADALSAYLQAGGMSVRTRLPQVGRPEGREGMDTGPEHQILCSGVSWSNSNK